MNPTSKPGETSGGCGATRRTLFGHCVLIFALALCGLTNPAAAHDSPLSYLEITETTADHYHLTWRTDARGAAVTGQRIEFAGLQSTAADVLVRVQRADGSHYTELVGPARPWFEFGAAAEPLRPLAFLRHGIEHIVTGIDHLLFVFGLLLLVGSPWTLIKTMTAFTAAHSITLALATLGFVHIPGPPIEASIALSILFLGIEAVRAGSGGSSFTIRNPWAVAFAFGLLHGFGFASGLTAIGLPAGEVPLALLWFNVGVELGQLAFVASAVLLLGAVRTLKWDLPARTAIAPACLVGALGAFWTIERVAVMMGGVQ